MAKLIAGLILLLAPFLLIKLFKDKKRGFIYILLFLIVFHVLLAFFTQLFGIFYYWVILGVNFLSFIFIFFLFFKNIKKINFSFRETDWVVLAVAVVSVLSLYQVHYNYSGKISMVSDAFLEYHEARNMQYEYPYFSDEWYAVSFIKESINSHSLPLKNPFDGSFFLNVEMFFHSFLAEIILLLGLDPLTQYTALSIFINSLIIVLAYLLLRLNNISKSASAFSSLSVLYITSTANLPGIWNLIPITMGIVLALLGFCFLSLRNIKMAILSGVFVTLFYPPLAVFYAAAMIAYFFNYFKTNARDN